MNVLFFILSYVFIAMCLIYLILFIDIFIKEKEMDAYFFGWNFILTVVLIGVFAWVLVLQSDLDYKIDRLKSYTSMDLNRHDKEIILLKLKNKALEDHLDLDFIEKRNFYKLKGLIDE